MCIRDRYKVEQLPWPADWAALFGRAAPLVMEIGFGSGLFPVSYTHLRAHETVLDLVCRLLLETKKQTIVYVYIRHYTLPYSTDSH